MATSLNVTSNASANQRLLVSRSGSHAINPGAVDDKGAVLQLRRPSLGERFGRSVANFFTLGWYTKNQNREQWAEFKRIAVSAELHEARDEVPLLEIDSNYKQRDLKTDFDHALARYDGKRLTRARAANVLAELQSIRNGAVPREMPAVMLDAKTNVVARAWRSMKQNLRGLSRNETQLRQFAQALKNSRTAEGGGWRPEDAMLSVLRPGRQISSNAIRDGQEALKHYAQGKGIAFRSYDISRNVCDELRKLPASEQWLEMQSFDAPDRPGLLAVPLQLTDGSMGHEPHSVLLTIDPVRKQITYFDAKADSMADAGKNYGNLGGNLEDAVKDLGEKLFGAQWNEQTGLLSLTIPKQQGSNDCGVFTHEFTRRMIDGESLGDIERSFTADDRKEMRGKMANDIRVHLLGDKRLIAEAVSDPKATGAQAKPEAQFLPPAVGADETFEMV